MKSVLFVYMSVFLCSLIFSLYSSCETFVLNTKIKVVKNKKDKRFSSRLVFW